MCPALSNAPDRLRDGGSARAGCGFNSYRHYAPSLTRTNAIDTSARVRKPPLSTTARCKRQIRASRIARQIWTFAVCYGKGLERGGSVYSP